MAIIGNGDFHIHICAHAYALMRSRDRCHIENKVESSRGPTYGRNFRYSKEEEEG